MHKLGISKIRIRVVHAKRIISHVYILVFLQKKKTLFKEVYSNLLLYEFSCILKIFNSRKWKFQFFFICGI